MNTTRFKIVAFGLVVTIAGILAQMRFTPQASGQPASKAAEKAGQTKPVSGPVVEGLILTISSLKKSYTANEPVLVTTKVKNVSKTTIELGGIYYWYHNRFQLSFAGRKNIPLTLFGQQVLAASANNGNAAAPAISLKPGKTVQYIFVLNRLHDMSLNGTYRVSVSAQVPKLSNHDGLVAIKSNQVTIGVQATPVTVNEEDLPKAAPAVR